MFASTKAAYLSKKYGIPSIDEDFYISYDESLHFLYDLCNNCASLVGIEFYKYDTVESTLEWVGSAGFRGESYKTFLDREIH